MDLKGISSSYLFSVEISQKGMSKVNKVGTLEVFEVKRGRFRRVLSPPFEHKSVGFYDVSNECSSGYRGCG